MKSRGGAWTGHFLRPEAVVEQLLFVLLGLGSAAFQRGGGGDMRVVESSSYGDS
jgi:hypothetical protein